MPLEGPWWGGPAATPSRPFVASVASGKAAEAFLGHADRGSDSRAWWISLMIHGMSCTLPIFTFNKALLELRSAFGKLGFLLWHRPLSLWDGKGGPGDLDLIDGVVQNRPL